MENYNLYLSLSKIAQTSFYIIEDINRIIILVRINHMGGCSSLLNMTWLPDRLTLNCFLFHFQIKYAP